MDSNKRKGNPDHRDDGRGQKKRKAGTGGKWQTPHQREKFAQLAQLGETKIKPGDVGIWATCVKGKEGPAKRELMSMFAEYAEKFYGLAQAPLEEDDDGDDDIEAAIQKEKQALADKESPDNVFTPAHVELQCVLFVKTKPPVVPVDFVHRICEDTMLHPANRKSRFLNRLTPMTLTGRATEDGLCEVAKTVLAEHFQMADASSPHEKPCSYAIRPTIRMQNNLKRDVVIKSIASLISENHKVDLTNPDKVIIVEIYQTICGISVVGEDWERLKRYNLAEIYQPTPKPGADPAEADDTAAKPSIATTDEAQKPLEDDTKLS